MTSQFNFSFDSHPSRVLIQEELPAIRDIADSPALIICDSNSEHLARRISAREEVPILVLKDGEKSKKWATVQKILRSGIKARLGRDGLFIGVGGGVIGDLCSFAASIYMRGVRLCLVSTTLLGMIDASLGGKTGIHLFGLKNMAGTFYPAGLVVIPLSALETLPESEWKSGMAELIKTAILDSHAFLELVKELKNLEKNGRKNPAYRECLKECISRAVAFKGRIVEQDPKETGTKRALLNLGHTFGHALEAAVGLGEISHGEAVAWGMVRAGELGLALGLTPPERAREITELINSFGFETRAPYPFVKSHAMLWAALENDKKRAMGKSTFIVPGAEGALIVSPENASLPEGPKGNDLLRAIINGSRSF